MNVFLENLDTDLIKEIEDIIDANYAETAHFDIPLDIDWTMYLGCGEAFKAFVMRDKNFAIAGVLFFLVSTYPHIKTLNMAQQITFYVIPEFRRYSLLMIKASEIHFKKIGVDLIVQSARHDTGFCSVLEAKGYERTDVTFVKRVA